MSIWKEKKENEEKCIDSMFADFLGPLLSISINFNPSMDK